LLNTQWYPDILQAEAYIASEQAGKILYEAGVTPGKYSIVTPSKILAN
jgi:hypothetical protein